MSAVIKFTEKPLHKKKAIVAVSTLSVHEPGLTPLLDLFFSGRFSVIGRQSSCKMSFFQNNQVKILIVN